MLWNYLHLNKKLVVGNLKWKCENKAKTNIANNTPCNIHSVYSIREHKVHYIYYTYIEV